MRTINLTPGAVSNTLTFNKEDNTFYGTERDIPFDTSYEVKNTVSGQSEVFDFIESTGSEWDPKTQWIYKNKTGLSLIISNDERITKIREEAYLKAKLRN